MKHSCLYNKYQYYSFRLGTITLAPEVRSRNTMEHRANFGRNISKEQKFVHTWVSVVGRKFPSPLLPLKKVCVVGIQKRGGKLRAQDGGNGVHGVRSSRHQRNLHQEVY